MAQTQQETSGSSADYCFIFFADICQSTSLYDNLGDLEAARLMKYCLEACAAVVADHAGRLVDTRGDEVLCLFASGTEAMSAAQGLHAMTISDPACREHQLALRIGIHYGPVVEMGDEIYGDAVNVAARIADKSKAGQTLLSADVKAVCPEMLGDLLRPLGSASIRGKQGSLELFELLSGTDIEDITEVSRRIQSPQRSFRLELDFQGQQMVLSRTTARFTLGRSTQCDLCVPHASVSRLHAEIRYRNRQFHLFDVSTNGTQVTMGPESRMVHRSDLLLQRSGTICLGRTISLRNLHIGFRAK